MKHSPVLRKLTHPGVGSHTGGGTGALSLVSLIPAAAVGARCDLPALAKVDDLGAVLRDHALSPRNNRTLEHAHGRAVVKDEVRGCAVRVAIRVDNGLLADVVFRAFGDLALTACMSFVTESARTLPWRAALALTTDWLQAVLELPDDNVWCLEMALQALHESISAYCAETRRQVKADRVVPSTRHRHRQRSSDTDRDEEFEYIVGLLRELLLLEDVATSVRHVHLDRSSKDREDLLCDYLSLQEVIRSLPRELQETIELVGRQGMTYRQAAEALGISHVAVQKRLHRAAATIRKQWGGGGASGQAVCS